MTPEQALDILAVLEESRQYFESVLDAVPADRAARRITETAWSPLEIVEHVTFAERAMVAQLMRSTVAEDGTRNFEKEIRIYSQVRNRGVRVTAPERAWPAGRFGSLEAAREAFRKTRASTLEFARKHQAELARRAGQHMAFGPVNGVELLAIVAGHCRRHADQIREQAEE